MSDLKEYIQTRSSTDKIFARGFDAGYEEFKEAAKAYIKVFAKLSSASKLAILNRRDSLQRRHLAPDRKANPEKNRIRLDAEQEKKKRREEEKRREEKGEKEKRRRGKSREGDSPQHGPTWGQGKSSNLMLDC